MLGPTIHAGGDLDVALTFAGQAMINSADAVPARDGYSAGSHVVRFGCSRLPAVYTAERSAIDQIRSSRNTAQYEASGGVDAARASRSIELADRAIEEVRALL